MPTRFYAIVDFIRLTRPVFLLGGILLYGVGLAIAVIQGAKINVGHALIGQLVVSTIQLMAQYANEYYDIEGDRLNAQGRTLFSGGSGVLPAGNIKPKVVLTATYICASLACLLIVVTIYINPLAGTIAILALLGSWFYSAPPVALMGTGWGELTTSLIVALLVPLTGYVLQTSHVESFMFVICLPLVLIHWTMLIAFELPDYEADRRVEKLTQTVRLGLHATLILHSTLISLALIIVIVLVVIITVYARYLWLVIPLLIWQGVFYGLSSKMRHSKLRMNILTTGAVVMFSLATLLTLIGLVIPGP